MFKITNTCKGGGYRYARTIPLHPKANSKGLYPLHRVLMENKLRRLLVSGEVVHHKNGCKSDDRIENLELMLSADHSRHHQPMKKLVKCRCGFCKDLFALKAYVRRLRIKRNLSKDVFCSISCGKKYYDRRRNATLAKR